MLLFSTILVTFSFNVKLCTAAETNISSKVSTVQSLDTVCKAEF